MIEFYHYNQITRSQVTCRYGMGTAQDMSRPNFGTDSVVFYILYVICIK